MKSIWLEKERVQRCHAMIANSGKKVAGPLLLVSWRHRRSKEISCTHCGSEKTAEAFLESQLEFVLIPKVVPALQASQRLSME